MWYKNVGTSFFHFVTNHAFARRTDVQTDERQHSHGSTVRLHYVQSHGKQDAQLSHETALQGTL